MNEEEKEKWLNEFLELIRIGLKQIITPEKTYVLHQVAYEQNFDDKRIGVQISLVK